MTTDIKISAIPSATSLSSTDLVLVVKNPSGTPTTNTITVANLRDVILTTTDPTSTTPDLFLNLTVSGNIALTAANATNLLYLGSVGAAGNGVVLSNSTIVIGNTTVNSVTNATNFTGTANNSTYHGGSSLATVQAQITGNAATAYTNATTYVTTGGYTVTGNVTANVMTVTSNTLTLGSSSLATNGYSRLTNGLLLQWGQVSANSTTAGNITFPTAFSVLYNISADPYAATYNATYTTQILAANTTTANVRTGNTTTATVYYSAIGT